VLWLAACLAGTQLAGNAHRIVHPHGPAGHVLGAAHDLAATPAGPVLDVVDLHAANDHAHDEATHDCAAYDAAALGDGPPMTQAAAAPPPPSGARQAPCRLARPAAAPRPAFQSRAPPRA
jgi:hypothetical protein